MKNTNDELVSKAFTIVEESDEERVMRVKRVQLFCAVNAYIDATRNICGALDICNWDADNMEIHVSQFTFIPKMKEAGVLYYPKAKIFGCEPHIVLEATVQSVRLYAIYNKESAIAHGLVSSAEEFDEFVAVIPDKGEDKQCQKTLLD